MTLDHLKIKESGLRRREILKPSKCMESKGTHPGHLTDILISYLIREGPNPRMLAISMAVISIILMKTPRGSSTWM